MCGVVHRDHSCAELQAIRIVVEWQIEEVYGDLQRHRGGGDVVVNAHCPGSNERVCWVGGREVVLVDGELQVGALRQGVFRDDALARAVGCVGWFGGQ